MKVLHVVPTYLPATRYGGPIYSVHGLCKSLVARGYEVHVFTTNVDGNRDSDVPINMAVDIDGVKVWYFPSGVVSKGRTGLVNRIVRRLYYSPLMKRTLQQSMLEFDLVHLHSVFLWPTSMAARLAYHDSIPYVLSPRGMLVKNLVQKKSRLVKTAWLNLIEKKTLERAAALHVTSADEAADLAKFSFDIASVVDLANGVDYPQGWLFSDLTEDVAQVISNGGYVIYFGRINWKKGLDRLLQAWANVTGWQLVIAGNDEENYLPSLHQLVAELDIQEKVIFITRSITGSDKEALLQSASLLVLPSYSENFGNVVPEAMVREVPVVVTDEVGARVIVSASEGGQVVGGDQLGEAINTMLLDAESRVRTGRRGREWVIENLTWDTIAAEMHEIYSNIVDTRLRRKG